MIRRNRPKVAATATKPPTTVALRCAGALLQESPLEPNADATLWVALIRSTNRTPDGWVRQLWQPSHDRLGWLVPAECRFGAVVEFGADLPPTCRRPAVPVRWHGIAVAHERDWLVLHGPYPHPSIAEQIAVEWLTPARAQVIALHDPTATPVVEQQGRPPTSRRTDR
jgi:hypothetical protein